MLRAVWNICALLALTMFWSALALPLIFFLPRRTTRMIAPRWARSVLAVCGVNVVVEGIEHLDPEQGYLLMINHTSHFDVIALYATLPKAFRFVAKKELVYVPFFGWALAAGGAVIIDRKNRERALKSIERARRLLESGDSVAFFPEGTRTPAGTLGELKKGAFHLATGAQATILPIAVIGSGDVLPSGGWRIRGGEIRLVIGAPMPPVDGPDDKDSREKLRFAVADRLRALMGGFAA